MIQSPAGYQGDVRIKRYLDFYQAGYGVTMLSGATAFTPASLFAASVPGAWYDPSDFSTMFQDIFGTVPVTAVGQPVGLIRDKSRTINRSNLITNGTFTMGTTGWTAVSGAIAAVSGELEVTGSGGSYPRAEQTYNLVVGKTYRISATARRGTATGNAYIAHTSGALYAETSSTTNVTLTYTFTATTVSNTAVAGIFASGVTGTAYFDNFVVEEISPADAFQATAAARPVLQQEAGGQYYLAFDGTDDFLVTSSIDLSPSFQMATVAGVEKSTDTAGIISEGGTTINSSTGKFSLRTDANPDFSFISRGTINAQATSVSTYTIPARVVLTGLGDIANDLATLRINGVQVSQITTDQGTGPFGSHVYYIGRRAGTSVSLNGRLYGMIILGRSFAGTELSNTEAWMNEKTGAY